MLVVGMAATLLGACDKTSGPTGGAAESAEVVARQVVARIDGEVITVADLERHIAQQPPFVRARYSAFDRKKELLENLVRFEVMAREARRLGYHRDPEVVRFFKQQTVNHLVQREFDAKMKVEDVPEADAEKHYREHLGEFGRPEEVRVSQIFLKDRAAATRVAALAKALRREDDQAFRDLVSKYSEDEDSKMRAGDLAFFDRKTSMVPQPLVEAAFALKEVNDVSGPVETDSGFHVLKLTQRRPGFTRPFPEVKRQIQTRLFHEMRTKKMEEWVAQMRSRLKVEVFEDKLNEVRVEAATQATQAAEAPPAPARARGDFPVPPTKPVP
jgi:peptidyl-prolyl cis-trans isomerase C